jgi:ankyrin repeat protein
MSCFVRIWRRQIGRLEQIVIISNFFNQLLRCTIFGLSTVTVVALTWSSLAFCGEIHDAAKAGDMAKVEALLKENPELVSSQDNHNSRMPLHLAVEEGKKDVAELLLAKGADVNARDSFGATPLHISATKDIAELLLTKGADVNAKDTEGGTTPLHKAVHHGHKDVAELLLAKGADVNARDVSGVTPLHISATKDIAELLLAKGADVHARDTGSNTPLDYSATKDIAELLLATGADVHAREKDRIYPLHRAALWGNKDVVELLLAHGADVNARANGQTPLHVAAASGRKDVAELLLATGADVNARDNDGATPLHMSATKDLAELLLAKGADINAREKDEKTPLHKAVYHGHKDVAELLLAKGANVDARAKDGKTPLRMSATKGIEELLLAHNADINAKADDGWTPFNSAAANDHQDVVELLKKNWCKYFEYPCGESSRMANAYSLSALDITILPLKERIKSDGESAYLPISIKNNSQSNISVELAPVWYGGSLSPTDLYGFICDDKNEYRFILDGKQEWRGVPLYLKAEKDEDRKKVISPGSTVNINVSLNYTGTHGNPLGPLVGEFDRDSGHYKIKSETYKMAFVLVFDVQGKSQYTVSDLYDIKIVVENK